MCYFLWIKLESLGRISDFHCCLFKGNCRDSKSDNCSLSCVTAHTFNDLTTNLPFLDLFHTSAFVFHLFDLDVMIGKFTPVSVDFFHLERFDNLSLDLIVLVLFKGVRLILVPLLTLIGSAVFVFH